MDSFEKQQRIDSIRGIVRVRWFSMAIIVALGLIAKTKFFGGMWGNFFDFLKILAMGGFALGCNFAYWLYIRRPVEKMSDKALGVVSALQVVLDQALFTLIYYYTGTIETMAFLLYYITILIASSLYKLRGIVLSGIIAVLLYSGATLADYYRFIPHIYSFPGEVGWFGHLYMTRAKIIGFIFYTSVAVLFSAFLSNLFRQKIKTLRHQSNKLTEQHQTLVTQTQELQVAKMDLEGEKNKVEAVIKSLTDGLILLDDERKIVLINKIAKKFFNIANEEEILGKKIEQIQTPEIRQLNQILSSKPGQIIKAEMALPKPSDRILEISTADVFEADRRFIGKIIVSYDVTREKAIDKIKSDFVSITAHQLRTPLTAIKWVFDLLLAGDTGKISPQQQEIINKGNKSNERIIMLIDDLLEVARIEEGRFNYKFSKLPFADLLDTTLKKFAALIEEKKIKVGVIKPANFDPVIKADQEKMEMALFNLIENALRYTPDNGTVDIAFSPNPENKKLNFEIKDSGIGIPKDNYDRIFSKFFRGENAVKAETEGSGLGLFIVKNIIEGHSGKIWFESQEGVGTAFYFSLPLANEK